MTWETAYFNLMDQMGFVINGRAYLANHPKLRTRYAARRKAGMAPKLALGYAMGDCEKLAR